MKLICPFKFIHLNQKYDAEDDTTIHKDEHANQNYIYHMMSRLEVKKAIQCN